MRKVLKGSRVVILCCALLILACEDENSDAINERYVSIPDAKFESELIEQGFDSDGVVNQKLLKSDAEKVSRLDLNMNAHFGDISDLTGIEAFVNVTFLSAAGHDMESIDLSQNVLLDTIYLSGNLLTSIDLSKNKNLIFLDAQANGLSSIVGISELPHLKKLNVSWNDLEALSIQNESIEVLHASQNLLTSLNTEGSVKLKNVLLTSNLLTSVDFSSNTSIETLLVADNKIEMLNLQQNTKLKYLHVFENRLSRLDLSYNTELYEAKVDRNEALTCIKIGEDQFISIVDKSDYQTLSSDCQ